MTKPANPPGCGPVTAAHPDPEFLRKNGLIMATPRIVPDHLMTDTEVAALFGCVEKTVNLWANKGTLSPVPHQGKRHYLRDQVHALRDALMTETVAAQ